MAPTGCLNSSFFHGVTLQEAVEMDHVAPAAAKVVEPDLPAGEVADCGVTPLGQLHAQALLKPAEEMVLALRAAAARVARTRGTPRRRPGLQSESERCATILFLCGGEGGER